MAVRLGRRRTGTLPDAQRIALRALIAAPKFELIPLKNALEAAHALPDRATVTVTASPSHGIESTIELAEQMVAAGHEAVPHLSAHMIRGRAHLGELLERCRAAGFREAFVVGGDAKDRGELHDGLALLRAMHELGHPFETIGVPGYPEGHPDISGERLLEVLLEKQRYASYMATQMCFNPGAIVTWIAGMRRQGVTLPVHLGTPGVADIAKLMTISARIGIAGSARYLKKNKRMVGHLLTPGKFGPDALLEGVAPALADPGAKVEALHLFTFNQVGATVEWQRRMLASLDD
ncbi:MAG: methylenetetrahydrofolate reductase [Actinobacteria bacterium]|nr:methylenetetrahydrofolate reductase [Actinomycetota bacterium]MDQ3210022.1 methylenetetrahydrofolate reductase [Actinomycetota bacterium]